MPDTDMFDAFRASAAPPSSATRASARARLQEAIAREAGLEAPAGVQTRSSWRRTRPLFLLAVLTALAALLVVPAFGLGSRLVELVNPDKPPTVKQELGEFNHPGMRWNPQVIAAKAHRVLSIGTGSDRSVLWVAPTRLRGACWVVRGAHGFGSCAGPENFAHGLSGSVVSFGTVAGASIAGAHAAIVGGHAGSAASVELRYADGERSVLPLTHGWFLFAVPALHRTTGHEPVTLVSLDARGRTLHATQVMYHAPGPVHRETPIESSIRLLDSVAVAGGAKATLWTARTAERHTCDRVLVRGRSLRGPAWECGARVGNRLDREIGAEGVVRDAKIHWDPGVGGDEPTALPLGAGWAAAPISALRVRFADGTSEPLELHDRLFVYAVAPRNLADGHGPRRLEGLDEHGKVIATLRIDRRRCQYGVKWACRFP